MIMILADICASNNAPKRWWKNVVEVMAVTALVRSVCTISTVNVADDSVCGSAGQQFRSGLCYLRGWYSYRKWKLGKTHSAERRQSRNRLATMFLSRNSITPQMSQTLFVSQNKENERRIGKPNTDTCVARCVREHQLAWRSEKTRCVLSSVSLAPISSITDDSTDVCIESSCATCSQTC